MIETATVNCERSDLVAKNHVRTASMITPIRITYAVSLTYFVTIETIMATLGNIFYYLLVIARKPRLARGIGRDLNIRTDS